MKHTPGLWEVHGRTVYAGTEPVALAYSSFDAEDSDAPAVERTEEEAAANARLIAAAPALLAVCKRMLQYLENAEVQKIPFVVGVEVPARFAKIAICRAEPGWHDTL